ncbi:MAG TPA: carboxypeptidase-like regulatory domain-containing protein [Bacteroidales bacterium]|nr:carboxypeptidase-like regulatory domain-containing protein [Bacteroidales bacterium]
MRLFLILFFFYLFQGIDLQGQKRTIQLQGNVMASESLSPLPDSRIVINRKIEAVTDAQGNFSLVVLTGDTVTFSRLGYKDTQMVINDSLKNTTYTSGIFMDSDTISIDEVIIVPSLDYVKADLMNPSLTTSREFENAKYNIAFSAYMGRNSAGSLGDPSLNYNLIHKKQTIDASEKGGIASSGMVSLNPLAIGLAAVYLIKNGLPEKPQPIKRTIPDYELELIKKEYLRRQRQ